MIAAGRAPAWVLGSCASTSSSLQRLGTRRSAPGLIRPAGRDWKEQLWRLSAAGLGGRPNQRRRSASRPLPEHEPDDRYWRVRVTLSRAGRRAGGVPAGHRDPRLPRSESRRAPAGASPGRREAECSLTWPSSLRARHPHVEALVSDGVEDRGGNIVANHLRQRSRAREAIVHRCLNLSQQHHGQRHAATAVLNRSDSVRPTPPC